VTANRPPLIERRGFRRLWQFYWVLLFGLTHAPQPGWPSWAPEPSDKTMHLVAYFLLAGAGWLVLTSGAGRSQWQPTEWFGVVAVYGACDEVTQPIFGRNCSVLDWTADGAGAILAIGAIEVLRWRRRARHRA